MRAVKMGLKGAVRDDMVLRVLRHVSRVVDHAWVQGADLVSIFVTKFLDNVELSEGEKTRATTKEEETQTWMKNVKAPASFDGTEEWGLSARNPFTDQNTLTSLINSCFLRALFPDGRCRKSGTGTVAKKKGEFCELAKRLGTWYMELTGKPLLTLCSSPAAAAAATEQTDASADGASLPAAAAATERTGPSADGGHPRRRSQGLAAAATAGPVGHADDVTRCDLGPVKIGSHGVVPYASFLTAAAEQFRESWQQHLLVTPSIYKGQEEAVRALLGRAVFPPHDDDVEPEESRPEGSGRGRLPRSPVQKRDRSRSPGRESSDHAEKERSKRVKRTTCGEGKPPAAPRRKKRGRGTDTRSGRPAVVTSGGEESDGSPASRPRRGKKPKKGKSPASSLDLPVKAVAKKLWPDPKWPDGAKESSSHCDGSKAEERIEAAIKVVQDELRIGYALRIEELRESFRRLIKVSALVPWDKWGLKEWDRAKKPPRPPERKRLDNSTMYAFDALPFVAEVASVCSTFNKELDAYKERLGYEEPVRVPAARRPRKQAGGSSPPSRLEASRKEDRGNRKEARADSFPKPCRVRLPHILPGDRPPSLILRNNTLRRVLGWLNRVESWRSKLPKGTKLTGIGKKMPFHEVWTHLFNRKATFARGGQFRREGEKARWVSNLTGHTDGQALSVCFVRLVPAGTAAGAKEAVSSERLEELRFAAIDPGRTAALTAVRISPTSGKSRSRSPLPSGVRLAEGYEERCVSVSTASIRCGYGARVRRAKTLRIQARFRREGGGKETLRDFLRDMPPRLREGVASGQEGLKAWLGHWHAWKAAYLQFRSDPAHVRLAFDAHMRLQSVVDKAAHRVVRGLFDDKKGVILFGNARFRGPAPTQRLKHALRHHPQVTLVEVPEAYSSKNSSVAAFPEVKQLLDDVTGERRAAASRRRRATPKELPRPKRGEPWEQTEDHVVEAINAGMEHEDLEVGTRTTEDGTTEHHVTTKPGKSREVHLHHVYRKTDHDGGRALVWGLKYCSEGKVILDRDRNAARNMLLCYLHRVRLAKRGKTARRRFHFTVAGNAALSKAAKGKSEAEYDIGEPRHLVSPAEAP